MATKINPTVVVYVVAFGTYSLLLGLSFGGAFDSPGALISGFVVQTLLTVVLFTVLHDCVHKSASKSRWLNEGMLHSLWIVFLNAPQVFKWIHLTHHSHTNKERLDPDHFTASSTWLERWARSFLLIFYYYYFSVLRFPKTLPVQLWNLLSGLGLIAAISVTAWHPQGLALWALWILPSFVGIGVLGFLNTAWPHAPGKDTSKIKNTKILLVPAPLRWLMLNQNYHLLHHLRPQMPWYEYPTYWRLHRDRLLHEGADLVDYRVRTFQNESSACKQSL